MNQDKESGIRKDSTTKKVFNFLFEQKSSNSLPIVEPLNNEQSKNSDTKKAIVTLAEGNTIDSSLEIKWH